MSTIIYSHNLVYRITNIVNNKTYIGVHSTNDINDSYFGSGNNIKAAIKKYGIDNFVKEIIFDLPTRKQALDKEYELVTETYVSSDYTYNIALGGGRSVYSAGDEHHWWGRQHSEETKAKISASRLGKKLPACARKGESNGMFGVTGEDHPNWGTTHSDTTKAKMSESWKNRTMLKCQHCSMETKSASNMSRHIKARHKEI